MFYKLFLKIREKEYEIEIEDITDQKSIGKESYSKGILNKFSKPAKKSSILKDARRIP